mgnify:CR=1 FL=1
MQDRTPKRRHERPATPHMTHLTCPDGFLAHGVTAGLKPSGKPDLAVVLAPRGATAAALLTTNLVHAAPLVITADHLARTGGRARALLINAGCANAATGPEGERRARACVAAVAKAAGCRDEEVLVNSTGVIGVQLPVERIVTAVPALLQGAAADGFERAAGAIMTTDTRMKVAEARDTQGRFRVVGMAKGAGMIHPSMAPAGVGSGTADAGGAPHATMIAVMLTDATVDAARLEAILSRACDRSFHRITVDGDTSTNDAVFALASGAAGRVDEAALEAAFTEVARTLALQVVRDGEGATRVLTVAVEHATTRPDALAVARTVAMSLLVRTAVAGGDPNWGRILAAIGRAGVPVDLQRLTVTADGVRLFASGAPIQVPPDDRARIFRGSDVRIEIDLALGDGSDEFHTCDLTKEYVAINAEYTT